MKKRLSYALFGLITTLLLCSLSAFGQAKKRDTGQPRPVQVQTVDSIDFLVQYIPLDEAKKNLGSQITQLDKQAQTVEKQLADLLKKRDDVLRQKSELETLLKQLRPLPPPPPPTVKTPAGTTTPPPPEKNKGKPKKPKAKTKKQ